AGATAKARDRLDGSDVVRGLCCVAERMTNTSLPPAREGGYHTLRTVATRLGLIPRAEARSLALNSPHERGGVRLLLAPSQQRWGQGNGRRTGRNRHRRRCDRRRGWLVAMLLL
ncbi:unnamed protein product, partial [Pylaiella littoralis]